MSTLVAFLINAILAWHIGLDERLFLGRFVVVLYTTFSDDGFNSARWNVQNTRYFFIT